MKKIYPYLLLAITMLFTNTLKAQVNVNDSLALVDLYNSTDGPHWYHNTNWLTSEVKYWHGVSVDSNRVTYIELGANDLSGSIPSSLGNLTNLSFLDLSLNQLSGSIPSSFGNLTKLYELALSINQLSGSIPSSFGNLTNLIWLELNSNQLSGSIPSELGNLKTLKDLELSSNQLSGSIPPELGNLTNLNILFLPDNQLSGSIPPELSNLKTLTELVLTNNQLSGSIPSELGNLKTLTDLVLSHNLLSGNIPLSFGNLKKLSYLYLSGNQLSGSIPPGLGNLTKLNYLDLSGNQLSGSIPPEFGNLTHLSRVFLNNNQLTGNIPLVGKISRLRFIDLSHNKLNGSIPPELGNFTKLKSLDLGHNQLSGNIPPALGNLTTLNYLDLSHNQLSGSIPPELVNITNYPNYQGVDLDLSGNQLSGSIPSSFGNFKSLRLLYLNNNQLSGSIPAGLGSMHSIDSLILNDNQYNFDDIEPFVQHKNNSGIFQYFNQTRINIFRNGNTLSAYAGGTLSNNTYKWYKSKRLVSTVTGDSAFTPTRSGYYTVQVTNSIAIALTLYSDTVNFGKTLPVTLVSFTGGLALNNTVALKWITTNELMTGYFVVERATDTRNYIAIDTIYSNGKGGLTESYSAIDFNPSDGLNYYRLKIVDADGTSVYSPVINVKIISKTLSVLYPNPAKNIVTIVFAATGNYTIKLTDVSGNLLQTKTGVGIEGKNRLQFDVSKYAAGVYFITISDKENREQTLRLNKQ